MGGCRALAAPSHQCCLDDGVDVMKCTRLEARKWCRPEGNTKCFHRHGSGNGCCTARDRCASCARCFHGKTGTTLRTSIRLKQFKLPRKTDCLLPSSSWISNTIQSICTAWD